MKKLLIFVGLLVISVSQAQISEPGHIAQALKRSITLDADMSDWEGLPRYEVALSNTEEPSTFEQAGYFSVAWDDAFLYVMAVFRQPQDSLTIGLGEDAEEWWLGDTFELFIRFADGQDALHYAANPDGARYKAFLTSNDFEVLSAIEEERWMVELAFPLAKQDLLAIETGDAWAFKVGRGFHSAQEFSLWPMGGDFLAEDNYGLIYFTEQIESDTVLFDRLK